MLNKKEYGMTLLIASTVFFIMLAITAGYYAQQTGTSYQQASFHRETERPVITQHPEEVVILPNTKITLKIEDLTTHKELRTTVDAVSLLGLNKEELAQRFDDYSVETFNEKEVCLTKAIESEQLPEEKVTYVLAVLEDRVCIKQKDRDVRPIRIDYDVYHLSSYVYSLLLNEEIEITKEQKEALLLNPSVLQKILQSYVGE